MSLQYFLKIDGVSGDGTQKSFEKWYAVDGFSFGETTPTSSVSSGRGVGRTQFSPLTVDIHSLAGLTTLLHDAASNKAIKSVELVAVDVTEGEAQTVYDLKLSNAQISSIKEAPGSKGLESELTFSYAKGSLTEPVQTGDGVSSSTFSFGASSSRASTTSTASATTVPQVPSDSPLHYYLKVDGVSGDGTQKGFEKWYAVDGFDFGETTPTSAGSAGRGVGRTQFSPLTVDIHSLAGLTTLLHDEAANKAIKSVELVAVRDTDGGAQTVYDLKLSNAQISSIQQAPGSNGLESELKFNYTKGSLTEPVETGDGVSSSTFSFGASSSRGSITSSAQATTVPQVPNDSPLRYFLKVDGVSGDGTQKGFEKWYAVDGFEFGETTPTSAGSSGRAVGRTQFSPLTVDIHSLAGLTTLLGDEASNKALKSVELVAVSENDGEAQTVYDLKLSNAQISSIQQAPGSNGLESELKFNYSKGSLTEPVFTGDGGPTTTFSFGASSSGASTTPSAPTSASATTVPQVPSDSPLRYFLKVDAVNGDGTQKGFEKWYAVDGFEFGETTPTSLTSSGRGAGRTQFSPLTVDIHSLAGLTTLLGDAASNKAIKSVELVAVREGDGQAETVYDLKLSNAQISSIQQAPGSNGLESELKFNYNKGTVTEPALGGDGGASTFSFGASTSAASTSPSAQVAAVPQVPNGSPLRYFLKVDGVNGDGTQKGFEKWYAVDGFDFGETNTSSSSSSGAGAGKTHFSPLTVDIHSLAGLTTLLGDAASGKTIKSVELVAVSETRDVAQTVYDLKLSNAQISSIQESPGSNGIESELKFNYSKGTVTEPALGGDGGTSTFSFGASTSTASASSSTSAAAVPQVPSDSPLQYFLKVDGINGDGTQKGFEKWYAVDGFDFGETTPSVGASSSGAGAGKTQFSPLTVDIHSLVGLTSLLGDAATGKSIKTVELVAVGHQGDSTQNVFDIKLSNANITSFVESPGANGIESELTFFYSKIAFSQPSLGVDNGAVSFSFDLNANRAV